MDKDTFEPIGADIFSADTDAKLSDFVAEIFEDAPAERERTAPSRRSKATDDQDTGDLEYESDEGEEYSDEGEFEDEDSSSPDYTDDEDGDAGEDDSDADNDLQTELEAIRAERDALKAEAEAKAAAEEADRENRAAQATQARWNKRHAEGKAFFDRKRNEVIAVAARLSPGDLKNRLDKIESGWRDWEATFHRNYAKTQGNTALDLAVRAFTAEARVYYGLSADETSSLADFARKYPDDELVADYLARMVQDKTDLTEASRRTSKAARKAAAQDVSRKTPRVGDGKRSQRKPKNIDEFIDSLDLPSFA